MGECSISFKSSDDDDDDDDDDEYPITSFAASISPGKSCSNYLAYDILSLARYTYASATLLYPWLLSLTPPHSGCPGSHF